MTDTVDSKPTPKTRRPLMFVVLGIFLFSAAGWLITDRLRVHTTIPIPRVYSYDIKQNVDKEVHYRQSSFYDDTPGPVNTAYIAALTDHLSARFHYDLIGSEPTQLSYRYDVKAIAKATYGSADSDVGLANVWTKQYQVLEPTVGEQHTDRLSLEPEVQIPYAKYRSDIDQFKNALNVPVNTELTVMYTVWVSGSIDGTPFENTQVATISAPLDQQIYKLDTKFTKLTHEEVVPKQSQRLEDIITRYEIPLAIVLTILGLAYTVYGLRKQIIKSPYQRQLEKIYRYHDGIIIHASRPADLAHKDIVMVKKFDDLLNLEEELKTPIVASQISDETTHFFIARDDIVYVFTLGVPAPFRQKPATPPAVSTSTASSSVASSNNATASTPTTQKRPPKRKVMG